MPGQRPARSSTSTWAAGRAGFLDVLRRMGAAVDVEDERPEHATADIRARYGPLRATDGGRRRGPGLIDEIPVLAVAAADAEGTTTFADAGELRVKESDRIATIGRRPLRPSASPPRPRPDGLVVHGRGRPAAARGRPGRLPRATTASPWPWRSPALAARHPCAITGWEAVATSYPAFEEDYRRGACHSHRRPRRVREVDRGPGGGRPPRPRLPRHRRHVPGRGLRGHAPRASTPTTPSRSPRWPSDVELDVGDQVIVDGVDATIEIRSPEVDPGGAAPWPPTPRCARSWSPASGSGWPPTAGEWSRAGTSARWSSPTPTLKVYLTADDDERAGRRSKEMLDLHYDQVAADIARRDHIDSTRPASPLERGRRRRPASTPPVGPSTTSSTRCWRWLEPPDGRIAGPRAGASADRRSTAGIAAALSAGLVRGRPRGGGAGVPGLLRRVEVRGRTTSRRRAPT